MTETLSRILWILLSDLTGSGTLIRIAVLLLLAAAAQREACGWPM